ncbi:MAG: peptidoglycan-associated lipoprotein [Halobacteriovoraceae bacterium]|nr:peptidoglycan-associated lipoprotein [Halobacteriovoraceae bacterium]|tara:strand:+ start:8894 stop:9406 length:513 start_codon:yes stop_codon:yes gene_type:complete
MKDLIKLSLTSLLMAAVFVGCSSAPKKEAGSDSTGETMIDDAATNGEFELQGTSDDGTAGPLKTIYFEFDSSALSGVARENLEANAEALKMAEMVQIQVEGHADERGGIQYNAALGERRARAVKEYLEALGVSAARIDTVTYGKEKPVAYGHDEESWAKNRRANFVITAK